MNSGRIEALVVALLTMLSSVLYVLKLSQWISNDGIKPYIEGLTSLNDQEQVKRVCNAVVYVSIAGNVASFLTSLPLFFVVSKDMETNRRRKYALLPYICCHVILCVTALNRLLMSVVLTNEGIVMKVMSVRIFDVLTLTLSVLLIGLYYRDLTFFAGNEEISNNNISTTYKKFDNEEETEENEEKKLKKSEVTEDKEHYII